MASGRNVINQSIQLEGGDEVKKKLEDIGKAGEEAGRKLNRAFADVNFGKGIDKATAAFRQSFSNLQKQFGQVGQSAQNLFGNIRDVGNNFRATAQSVGFYTLAITGAATAVGVFVKNGLDAVDNLSDQAASFGITSQALQGYQLAASAAGVDSDQFGKGLVKLNEIVRDLSGKTGQDLQLWTQETGKGFESTSVNGVKLTRVTTDASKAAGQLTTKLQSLSGSSAEAAKALIQVGIKDFQNLKTSEDLLLALADAFQKLPDGALKTSTAVAVFGERLGPKLVPFLNQGRNGILGFRQELEDLGLVLSDDAVKASGEASDSLTKLGNIADQFQNKFASLIAPSISGAVDAIFISLKANASGIDAFLQRTAQSFSIFIQDIIRLITGSNEPVETEWLKSLIENYKILEATARDVYQNGIKPVFDIIRSAGPTVANIINSILGTKLSGDGALIVLVLLQMVGAFKLFASIALTAASAVKLLWNILGLIAPLFGIIKNIFPAIAFGVQGLLRLLPALAVLLSPTGLIAAAVAGLVALIVAYWDELVSFTSAAFEKIKQVIADLWNGIKAVFEAAKQGIFAAVSDTFDGIVTTINEAYEGVKTAARTVWEGIKTVISDAKDGIVSIASDTFLALADTVSGAYGFLYSAAETAWSALSVAGRAAADAVSPIWESVKSNAASAFNAVATSIVDALSGATQQARDNAIAIRDAIALATEIAGNTEGALALANQLILPFQTAAEQIDQLMFQMAEFVRAGLDQINANLATGLNADALAAPFQSLVALIASAMSQIVSLVASAASAIQSQINAIIASIRAAIAQAAALRASAGGGGGGASGFATGGYVRGAGTGTSDSIPAWLSNGEFVIRAAAVRKYGVSFLRAINGLAAKKQPPMAFPAFSMGGLVEGFNRSFVNSGMPAPAFAGIAPQQQRGKSFDLVIGNERFSDLFAPEETANSLVKFASARKSRALGRKPSWYGG